MKDSLTAVDADRVGREMHAFISDLYPICRSITGDGIRETLRRVGDHISVDIHEVPTGTDVLDWTVPKEWNIRDAFIKNGRGERVVDFKQSNLHVVNYSVPFQGRLSLVDLRPHLFTLPDHPDWIPYRTSYYKEDWGFCLSQRQLESLLEEEYDVCIDSSLHDGRLIYGECYLAGELSDEVLFSCHICHPSLCNDNLSGVALAVHLASQLAPAGHALLVQVPVHTRHHRLHHLAGAQRSRHRAHSARAGDCVRGRSGKVYIQEEQAGLGRDRHGRGSRAAPLRTAP